MSERIFTLFGEEIIPEQLKAAGKPRTKKKPEEEKREEEPQEKITEEIKAEDARENNSR